MSILFRFTSALELFNIWYWFQQHRGYRQHKRLKAVRIRAPENIMNQRSSLVRTCIQISPLYRHKAVEASRSPRNGEWARPIKTEQVCSGTKGREFTIRLIKHGRHGSWHQSPEDDGRASLRNVEFHTNCNPGLKLDNAIYIVCNITALNCCTS